MAGGVVVRELVASSSPGRTRPDPVKLAYVRAPARIGMPMLTVDDLPIVDRVAPAAPAARRWPVPLVVSQAAELAGGKLDTATGDLVCERCGTLLGQRIVWSGSPAVIGLVRGHRWTRSRSWGVLPTAPVVAARLRAQWFCLLDRPTTPLHLPLSCPTDGPLSVPTAALAGAAPGAPLMVTPP
jgi:hypothetical protein